MINPVTGWFERTQYDSKRAISITNLVETTWLSIYPRSMEIMYDQGSKFISNEFIKSLIEIEYWITENPITLVYPTSNAILEWTHQVLVNLVWTLNILKTYVD